MKSLQHYVNDQNASDPEFAGELMQARLEARFAIALARLREKRGLTQQQLADAAGLRQPMLARYEKGQIPSLPTLQRLAGALGARVLIGPDKIEFQTVRSPRARGMAEPRPTSRHNRRAPSGKRIPV